MRRTVNVEFNPRPRRPITTPAKICMRSLSPSTTFVCTFTESPTPKSTGFLRNCSDSILSSIAWFIKSSSAGRFSPALFWDTPASLFRQIRPSFLRPPPRLFRAPLRDLRVVAREQHFRHLHPPEIRRPCVMRIFQQILAERLVPRTLVITQNARQQPRHRVYHHHRRQRPVRQH